MREILLRIIITSSLLLLQFVLAEGMTGRRGDDHYIKVPCGTVVTEKVTDSELLEGIDEEDIFGNVPQAYDADPPTVDLDEHGKCILVARGGKPGIGNKGLSGGKGKLFRSVVIINY